MPYKIRKFFIHIHTQKNPKLFFSYIFQFSNKTILSLQNSLHYTCYVYPIGDCSGQFLYSSFVIDDSSILNFVVTSTTMSSLSTFIILFMCGNDRCWVSWVRRMGPWKYDICCHIWFKEMSVCIIMKNIPLTAANRFFFRNTVAQSSFNFQTKIWSTTWSCEIWMKYPHHI